MTPGRLQQEVRKRQAFAGADQEAVLNVLRTADRLQIRLGRLFRSYGLTPSQYNVLRILRGEGQPLPILEVAGRTIAVVPAITGLIDRLECVGLVVRERSLEDRRIVRVAATVKALALLARIDEPLASLHRELAGDLTDRELGQLTGLLERLRCGVESV